MEFYFDRKDQGNDALPIFRFIAIKCCEMMGRELTKDEIEFKEKYNAEFGPLDVSNFMLSCHWIQADVKDGKTLVKNVVSDVRRNIIELNPQTEKNISGITELLQAVLENLTFAKNDIPIKGVKYNKQTFQELLKGIHAFQGKRYNLQKNISIRLSQKVFTHILVGHISEYKIHRKGYQTLFEKVHTCQDLLNLFDRVIKFIEPDIVEHFSRTKNEFNKTDIVIDGVMFGIHISQNGDIKTFYEKLKSI